MAEFVIVGDEFEPSYVTEKLNLVPDEFWVKGDDVKGRIVKRKDTTWSISTGYEESLDINDQLSKIMTRIQDKRKVLKEIRATCNVKFLFAIVVNIENNQKPAMHFNSQFIEFANDIKAEFYIDLYIY